MTRLLLVAVLLSLTVAPAAVAAPEGTLTIAMHFTPVARWLDPAEGESTITPYLLLYTIHDGLLKPPLQPARRSARSRSHKRKLGHDLITRA